MVDLLRGWSLLNFAPIGNKETLVEPLGRIDIWFMRKYIAVGLEQRWCPSRPERCHRALRNLRMLCRRDSSTAGSFVMKVDRDKQHRSRMVPSHICAMREQIMEEKPASFYDAFYARSEAYRQHYSDSLYFPLWVQMEFLLRPYREAKILDIGCGSGQFAQFLMDRGYKHYEGIDFSQQAIEMARTTCGFPFRVADAFSLEVLNAPYDVVVSMEVLEHITRDQDLVKGIRPGTICLFTVPSFDSVAHVRFFKSDRAVRSRYYEYLDIKETGFINRIFFIHAVRSNLNPSRFQRLMKTRENVTLRRSLSWVKQSLLRRMREIGRAHV